MATSVCEAQKLIILKSIEEEDDDFLTSFIAAGKPVFNPSYSEAPDVTPARELVKKEAE